VCAELLISFGLACVLWRALRFILSCRTGSIIKTGLVALAGYGVFIFAAEILRISHDQMPFEVFLERLLICMVGGFLTASFNGYRNEFKINIGIMILRNPLKSPKNGREILAPSSKRCPEWKYHLIKKEL
jgi:hypothetical protein